MANETEIEIKGTNIKKQEKHDSLHLAYNSWYTRSLPIVKIIAPDRYTDFVSLYKNPKNRSKIDSENYSISDYLMSASINSYTPHKYYDGLFSLLLNNQVSILKGVVDRLGSVLENIEGLLQSDIFDTELSAAKELQNKKHYRAAGVIAGVVLEKHLKSVIESHSIKISKNKPTLIDLNEALKTANIYDVPMWRRIQSLADIRNICAHGTGREPNEEEIDAIIAGVDKIIKNVF